MARPRNLLTNRSTRFRPPFTSRWRTSWNRSRRFLPTSSPGAGGLSATPLAVFDAELGARPPVYGGALLLCGASGWDVRCTAPAAATQYEAVPTVGAPVTGAATGGALFTFTTAGRWTSIRLKDVGGTVVAELLPTLFAVGRPDLLDAYNVRWTHMANSEPGYGCLQDAMLPVGGYPQVGLGYITIAAGQSIGCTAPAGTASYLATRHDSTTTAGAAAPGAFTFTTAGSWRSVQLLDAGATEVALFQASAAPWPARGHTDTYSVAWTVTGWTPTMVGHAQLGSTAAANTNAPKMLYRADTPYVWLPGAAGNTISCTAPAGTASYSAVDAFTGTATTGAAAPGAFTLQTLGQWSTVSLLDAGAVELARFDANLSTQAGHTDTYSVAWAINRSTTGKKSTKVDTRAIALHGTDDYCDMPAGALPNVNTTDNATFSAAWRRWHNPGAQGHPVVTTKASASNTGLGISLRMVTTAASTLVSCHAGDGTNSVNVESPNLLPVPFGTKAVHTFTVASAVAGYANTASATFSRGSVADATRLVGRIGTYTGGTAACVDAEIEAVLTAQAEWSPADHGRLIAHYGGGT